MRRLCVVMPGLKAGIRVCFVLALIFAGLVVAVLAGSDHSAHRVHADRVPLGEG